MKLNDKDIKLFEALHQSETGKALCDYLERIKQDIGYLPANTEYAKMMVDVIDKYLLDKVRLQTEKKESEKYQFE